MATKQKARIDRNANTPDRVRRAIQRIGDDGMAGILRLDDPSGLSQSKNGLKVKVKGGGGLAIDTNGVYVSGGAGVTTATQPLVVTGSNVALTFGNGLYNNTNTLSVKGFETVAGDRGGPSNGDAWYNSVSGKFRGEEGGAVKNFITTSTGTGSAYTLLQHVTAGDTVTFTDSLVTADFTTTIVLPAGAMNAVGDAIRITLYFQVFTAGGTDAGNYKLQYRIGGSTWQDVKEWWNLTIGDTVTNSACLRIETILDLTQLYTGAGTGRVRFRTFGWNSFDANHTFGSANSQMHGQFDAPSSDFNNTASQTITIRVVPQSTGGGGETFSVAMKELLVEGLN